MNALAPLSFFSPALFCYLPLPLPGLPLFFAYARALHLKSQRLLDEMTLQLFLLPVANLFLEIPRSGHSPDSLRQFLQIAAQCFGMA